MSSRAVSRRDALRRATLAAGALATPALLSPAIARGQDDDLDDAELEEFLIEAIALEQIAVVAYQTAADDPGLAGNGDLQATLEQFAEHDRAHARALRSALDSLGVELPDAPAGPDDAAAIEDLEQLEDARADELVALLAELGEVTERDDYLDYLLSLEVEQLELYVLRGAEVGTEDLLRIGAEIAACQAQHVVVLRQALGMPPAEAVFDFPRPPAPEAD